MIDKIMTNMKTVVKLFSFLFAFMLAANVSFAQEAETEISDEELRKYAIAMDSVERMKANIIAVMTQMVEENENITGARYNELNKIVTDSVALAEANATEEEIIFVKSVVAKKNELTNEINTTFKSLAIDYIGEGGRTYKKIKSALASDEEVKERYEDILEDIQEETEDAEEAEDEIEDGTK